MKVCSRLCSRREFVRQTGAASVLLLAARLGFPEGRANSADGMGLLALGDSLVWGQGLREEDKIYTQVTNWLRSEVLNGSRSVGLKVKAHSGATLKLHEDVAERLRRAGRDESQALHPEINVAFPSVTKQIELAANEYAAEGIPAGSVGLILLSGGISDIGVAKVLDPSGDDDELYANIEKYCRRDMTDVLQLATSTFPRARIAVLGYFPMISPQTQSSRVINSELELRRLYDPLKPLINNPVIRPFLIKKKKGSVRRSRIWFDESNKALKRAVDAVNAARRRPTAAFIRSPLAEANAFAAPNTLLFALEDGRTNDFRYAERKSVCKAELEELKGSTGAEHSIRLCEIAAIGHLDREGARRYAEAIEASGAQLSLRSR